MSTEIPQFYQRYLDQIKDGSVVENLMRSGDALSNLIQELSEEQGLYRYEEGKWTIKELVQHVIDAERIFCFRALTFARKDKVELAGFDENSYADQSFANERKLSSLLNEFHILRASSIDLFGSFNSEAMRGMGVASGFDWTVENIGYVISGHCLHHVQILKERYL